MDTMKVEGAMEGAGEAHLTDGRIKKSRDPTNEISQIFDEVEDRQDPENTREYHTIIDPDNNDKILSQNSETQNMHSQSQSHAVSQSSSSKSPDKLTPNLQSIGKKRSIDSESGDISLSQQPISSQQMQDGDLEQTDQETPTDNEQPTSKDAPKAPTAKRQKQEELSKQP